MQTTLIVLHRTHNIGNNKTMCKCYAVLVNDLIEQLSEFRTMNILDSWGVINLYMHLLR